MNGLTRVPVCPTHKRPLEIRGRSLACPSCASSAAGISEKEWLACKRKRGVYKTAAAAERDAKERGLTTYKCRYCDGFHLTSQGAPR